MKNIAALLTVFVALVSGSPALAQSSGDLGTRFHADDGRTLSVDTSQVDAQVRSAVQQGDIVSIVGKTTARADQFVAEVIERQARR